MGGGRAKYKKIFRARENWMKKIHVRQLTLRNIHATAIKKSYEEFDNEIKFLRLKNSPPPPTPHNFSNGPSLIAFSPIH